MGIGGGFLRALLGVIGFVFFIWFLFVGFLASGGTTAAATSTTTTVTATTNTTPTGGNLKHLHVKGRERPVFHPELDPNYMNKRRVPNGPDPIHNRRAGNSRQPPGRA
ncbi:CLAVATA3/ESR (CLE)-related protein 25-like [Tasmannia lanceolata]|uniref:CLAVATA3/ESR (CLE)-related protein 25-like n=1 Tax=Tasmannia lanceolata TaxID=3420 RepID=UPI004064506E